MEFTPPERFEPKLGGKMKAEPCGEWVRWVDYLDLYYQLGRAEVMLEREKKKMALVLDQYRGVTTMATLQHMAQCMAGLPGPRCELPRDHQGDHKFEQPQPNTNA